MVKAGSLKKRYISFIVKLDVGVTLGEEEFKRGFYAEAVRFFGEYGLSFVSLKVHEYDAAKRKGVVRCSRDKIDEVRGFLALINEINGKKVRVIADKTSGIVSHLTDTKAPNK
jgi:RNase P/RNase MRP subunit POP5